MKTVRFLMMLVAAVTTHTALAQQPEFEKYHRSSLYSLMLKHPEKEFCNEIIDAFRSIPIPEKYNNHNLKFFLFLM